MSKQTSVKNREKLSQLSKKELLEMILTQQEVIEYLKQEIEKLKVSRDLDRVCLPIAQMNLTEFAQTKKQWATSVNLKRFCSSPRQKKKPKPKSTYDLKHPHRSTARLLQQQQHYKRSP